MSLAPGLSLIDFFKLFLPVVLLILHAVWTLTYFRGLVFICLALLTALIFEMFGLKYGTLFGGHFVYQLNNKLIFFNIPLLVLLYWAVFIYISYNIVSSFLFWVGKSKPNKHIGGAILLPLLIFLDGLVVVSIDFFMEPLQVKTRNWIWLAGGPYYNIPLGNFIGWFIVATISTGIFRVFEYFSPQEPTKIDKSIFLIPVVGYGMLCLSLLYFALKIQLHGLALIGFFTMFPITVVNLIFFIKGSIGVRL
ncbi:MAG: carotenoid biosynthesis protein [bacterium]|nr:carotenoid biosynthesis protein [bacterium]